MPDKKISQLNVSGSLTGTEELPIVQSGTTFKTLLNTIKTFITSSLNLQSITNVGSTTTNSVYFKGATDTLAKVDILPIDSGNGILNVYNSSGVVKTTINGSTGITSTNFRVSGGTSSQFLKANGTVDNNSYVTSADAIYNATASGTDTYTVTISGITSYTEGDAYLIRFTNGNTTVCSLNINSLGEIPLYRNNDGALIGGDIQANGEMLCVYNSSANTFQCIGTSPNSLISYVTNDDSVTLTKGMAVYAFSGIGDRLTVKRAYNTLDSTSAQTIGLVMSTSIAANQKGFIMMQGLLDGLSILPTSTWTDGSPVYLGSTAGTITNIKPYAPNHLVYLGFVTTASNGSAGRLYIRVQNGYELDELHNVQAQSPTLKDTLWYDDTVSPTQWKTASIPTILGFTPENVANKENTTLDTSTTKYPTNNLVKTNIDTKVNANAAITGATKTKITYDGKGLVTSGADATTADIADSTNKRYVTDVNLTVIGNTSGTNTGDQTLSGLGGVPTSRSLTVNGTTSDLSADRTFTVTDANLSTSDITTNNVSITKHGFAPKLPNDATKYLDGTGAYSVPAGGGGSGADEDLFYISSFKTLYNY